MPVLGRGGGWYSVRVGASIGVGWGDGEHQHWAVGGGKWGITGARKEAGDGGHRYWGGL